MVDDHTVDLPPAPHMIVVRNDDRPGVIGRVGTILGEAQVNISDMNVGRNPDGLGALMVITTSDTVPDTVAERLRGADGVTEVYLIELGSFGDEG
jgi:D-3-phosphoglycerate dehydrogenase